MAARIFFIGASLTLTLGALPALAQSSAVQTLTPEQYEAQLREQADRIRAYRLATGTADSWMKTPQNSRTTGSQTSSVSLIEHVVVKGDTLYNVSKRYDVSADAIRSANQLQGNGISIGQTLLIPVAKAFDVTMAETSSLTYEDSSGDRQTAIMTIVEPVPETQTIRADMSETRTIYAVLPKDTLYKISRMSCTTVEDIATANKLDAETPIKPGQRLVIPDGHCLAN